MSRQLSFAGCSFSIQATTMEENMAAMYRKSVSIWREMKKGFDSALKVVAACESDV